MTAEPRTVTVVDADGKTRQEVDPWQFVPEIEITKELTEYFRKNPQADSSVWLIPARYAGGDWTAVACSEFPFSNAHRRLYQRSFRRVQ